MVSYLLVGSKFILLILGLLLCAVSCLKNNNVTFNQKQLGCVFENANYYVPSMSPYHPVYGQDVQPANFKNNNTLLNVLKFINEEFSNVMKNSVLNTMSTYVDFYEAFKKNSFSSPFALEDHHKEINEFYTFFKKFVPKFSNQQDSGMAIELLNRLINRYPGMSKSVHLVTCSKVVEKDLLFDLNIERTKDETFQQRSKTKTSKLKYHEPPFMSFEHSNVAALLRIRLEKRLGFVLMDLGFGFNKPVVIMEDGEFPDMRWANKSGKDTSDRWNFFLPRYDYVVAQTTSPEASESPEFPVPSDFRKDTRTLLYYIGKPYCSFLMTTTKPALMNSEPSIVRRDEKGSPMAYFDFDIIGLRLSNFNIAVNDGYSYNSTERNF